MEKKKMTSMDHEINKINKMPFYGMNMNQKQEMKNRIIDDINFIGDDYFNHDNYLSLYPLYKIFWILGSRGRGKTYSAKKLMINRFLKYKAGKRKLNKTVWIRRNDQALEKLRSGRGSTFLEPSLTEQKGVEAKIEGGKIYFKLVTEDKDAWEEVGTLFALQSNESNKGNHFEEYDLIVIDELVKGETEKKMFDSTRALANSIQTIARSRLDVMVLIYANTIGEVEEFKNPLGYLPMPENHGVYLFRHKRSVLIYAKDSDAWRKKKSNDLSSYFSANFEEFANVANKNELNRDGWVVDKNVHRVTKRRLYTLRTSEDHSYHVFGYKGNFVMTKRFFPRLTNENVYVLDRKLMGRGSRFNPEIVAWLKDLIDRDKIRFVDSIEMEAVINDLAKIGIIK